MAIHNLMLESNEEMNSGKPSGRDEDERYLYIIAISLLARSSQN